MRLAFRRLAQHSGPALIEYALILALASLGIVSALMILRRSLGNTVQGSGRQIDAAAPGARGQVLSGEPFRGGAEVGSGSPATGAGDD
jgi:Flp pilus assembly pilin Flp